MCTREQLKETAAAAEEEKFNASRIIKMEHTMLKNYYTFTRSWMLWSARDTSENEYGFWKIITQRREDVDVQQQKKKKIRRGCDERNRFSKEHELIC